METDRLIAVAGSVVVHLVLVGILAFTLWEHPEPPKAAMHKPIIQARAVDEAAAMAPVRRREAEEQRKRDEAERQRKAAEVEKKRKVEEQHRKAEAENQRQAEIKRKKAEAEKQREAELKRKEEDKRKQAEAEKQRIAEEKRKRAEAEQKRQAEERRKKEEAEAKLQRQMAEEAERLAAEERAQYSQQLALDQAEYLNAIMRAVKREWQRPPGSSRDFLCKVLVKQIPSGDVVDVRVIKSSGNVMIDRSVEMAVRKASPLPLPENRELFDRDLVITFVPE